MFIYLFSFLFVSFFFFVFHSRKVNNNMQIDFDASDVVEFMGETFRCIG